MTAPTATLQELADELFEAAWAYFMAADHSVDAENRLDSALGRYLLKEELGILVEDG